MRMPVDTHFHVHTVLPLYCRSDVGAVARRAFSGIASHHTVISGRLEIAQGDDEEYKLFCGSRRSSCQVTEQQVASPAGATPREDRVRRGRPFSLTFT